jgi:phosphatidate cytidylyltransferase
MSGRSGPSARWADLGPRLGSAVLMLAVGAAGLWAGGAVFHALVAAVVGLMVWELVRILEPGQGVGRPEALGISAAVAVFVFHANLPGWPELVAVALAVPLLGWRLPRPRGRAFAYLALILFAGLALMAMRDVYGLAWVLWLVLVVIGSDVAGYFVGRALGGPKFWPAISPKKTWSGTVAGWAMAAVLGVAFMAPLGASAGLVALSVLVALAGQMGDIAESALKRRADVKDSSNLIPGHGGVFDRFDAMIAAAVAFLVCDTLGLVGALMQDGAGG